MNIDHHDTPIIIIFKNAFILRSQAEYLQTLLPESHVVKALNVLSAYVLENGGVQGNKEVDSYSYYVKFN